MQVLYISLSVTDAVKICHTAYLVKLILILLSKEALDILQINQPNVPREEREIKPTVFLTMAQDE